jgi:hypothetical protein
MNATLHASGTAPPPPVPVPVPVPPSLSPSPSPSPSPPLIPPRSGPLTLRHYGLGSGDWQTLSQWHRARHGEPLPETILPPLGIICEDETGPVAAVFAHQSVGIGVAHADHFLTRPGLSFAEARRAGARLLEGLCAVLRSQDYGLLKVFTPCRALRRALVRLGFRDTHGALLLTTGSALTTT